MKDTLVVYFSRKGYAKRVAREYAAREDADLLELETSERTQGILGFWWCGRFGMNRMEMPLKPYKNDVSAYSRVIMVSPIWVFSACAPIYTFAHAEGGHVAQASYAFVHFSPFMRYKRTVAALDKLLNVHSDGYDSLMCCWGHIFARRSYHAAGGTAKAQVAAR